MYARSLRAFDAVHSLRNFMLLPIADTQPARRGGAPTPPKALTWAPALPGGAQLTTRAVTNDVARALLARYEAMCWDEAAWPDFSPPLKFGSYEHQIGAQGAIVFTMPPKKLAVVA